MNNRLVAYWQGCYFAATNGFIEHSIIGKIVCENLDVASGTLVNWKDKKYPIGVFVTEILTKEMPHMLKVKP